VSDKFAAARRILKELSDRTQMLAHMSPPRFAADAMLGRLARWLRVLGFDTSYDAVLADPELVQLANEEDRILLTRDRHLLRELRPQLAHEVRQDAPLEQLRDLVATLDLAAPAELFTRCMLCNTPLPPPLDEKEAERLLPPGVRGIPGPVRRCPACGRVYWHGSHVRRMREALQRAVPGWLH
jgi:uncharacterized protein with PIN domain